MTQQMKCRHITRRGFTIAIAGIALASARPASASRSQPIYNVSNPMPPTVRRLSLERIETSIVAAAGAQGWMTKHVSPGLLEATFRQKTHVAVVEIGFDKDKWTIVYKTSEHLNQDGNRIHPHYNAWIQKLERNINYKLSSVAP